MKVRCRSRTNTWCKFEWDTKNNIDCPNCGSESYEAVRDE